MRNISQIVTLFVVLHTQAWCAEGLVNRGEWRDLLPTATEQLDWEREIKDRPLDRTWIITDLHRLKKTDVAKVLDIDTLPSVASEEEVENYKKRFDGE